MKRFPVHYGVSLVEVILAVALFGLFATALIGLLVNSYGSAVQSQQRDVANRLAEEGINAVRGMRRIAWHSVTPGTYGLHLVDGQWQLQTEPEELDRGYTRTIVVTNVCLAAGTIVECSTPGGVIDPYRKHVAVTVTYTAITTVANTVTLETYLTNWQSQNWTQTDWSGGAGQAVWSSANRVASDDGNVSYNSDGTATLKRNETSSCGSQLWDMNSADQYVYDSSKIEVTSGLASLKALNPNVSGATTNPSVDVNNTGWAYVDWDQGTGEVNVTGARTATGGNPNGWLYVNFPAGNGDQVGGFWRQAISTTIPGVTATVTFDSSITQFAGAAPQSFRIYVFVDTTSGAPVRGQEAWVSAPITSTSGWTTQTIDVSNKMITSGTYYLKIAVWAETGSATSGAYRVGFDNMQLQWSGTAPTSYPTDRPAIRPVTSSQAPGVAQWNGFSEVAQKNGGEIYYQLSDDNGATWQYWTGTAWGVAGATNYSTAAVVNSRISTFPTSTQQILFKAFLRSNGAQQTKLDQVEVKCVALFSNPFDEPGDYTFDPALIEVVDSQAKLKMQAAPTGSGGTTNPSIDTDATGWTYVDWDQGTGEVNVVGARVATGGNPTGWLRITLPAGMGDQVGGFYRQPFATTIANAQGTLSFDWRVPQFTGTVGALRLYAFIDTGSGAPVLGTEVWSSSPMTATTNWTTQSNIDISAKLPTARTYYVKLAAWLITPDGITSGPYQVGFDNMQVTWSATGPARFPTTIPSITGSGFQSPGGVGFWTSFTQVAQLNGGQIYYQLSDDGGITWKYWNGSAWVVAGSGQYNTASAVNSALANFSTSTGLFNYRAFLRSNGTQDVRLDDVTVGYGANSGAAYAEEGSFESSAFNTGAASSYNFLSWSEILPSSAEDIKVQLATAPDNNGNPGTWSNWSGATGEGTFFDTPSLWSLPLTTGYNGNQWVKYKVILTGDGSETPVFNDITINYTP